VRGSVSVSLKLPDYQKHFPRERKTLEIQSAEMLRVVIKLIESLDGFIHGIVDGKPEEKKYEFPSLDFQSSVNLSREEQR